MNKDQVTGISERVLYGFVMAMFGLGVKKGWYDNETAAYLAGGAVTLIGGIWAWWINRPQALIRAAAQSTPGTVVVTTPEIANATPESNIVSNQTSKVMPK